MRFATAENSVLTCSIKMLYSREALMNMVSSKTRQKSSSDQFAASGVPDESISSGSTEHR